MCGRATALVFLALLVSASSLVGCDQPLMADPSAVQVEAEAPSWPPPGCAARPIRLSAVHDLTLSMQTDFEPFTRAPYERLVKRLMKCGGSVAVGVINDRPANRMVRFTVLPDEVVREPQRSDFRSGLDYSDALHAYGVQTKELEERAALFLNRIDALFSPGLSARSSDVKAALDRAATLHNEETALWGLDPVEVSLLITDARGNGPDLGVRDFPADTQILTVTGRRGCGFLCDLNPTEFEGTVGAWAHVEAIQRGL